MGIQVAVKGKKFFCFSSPTQKNLQLIVCGINYVPFFLLRKPCIIN